LISIYADITKDLPN